MSIEIADLTKSFGQKAVVDHVSTQIKPGTFTMVIGPSGCGKTTTLRLLAGFERPNEGTIRLGDRLLSSPRKVVAPNLRGMGMVFQSYATWPHLSVRENIVFGLRARHVDGPVMQKRYEWVQQLLSLQGLGDRYPFELSGGQQQRVSLARALVTEPEVLLLDEPLSNLDAPLRAAMRLELRRIQRETGITFVYVTHDQEEALSMGDSLLVMRDGEIVQAGTPRQIYEEPASAFVASFIGRSNIIRGRVTARDGKLATIEVPGAGNIVARSGDGLAVGNDVAIAIRKERVRLGDEGPNALEAQVEDLIYYGSELELLLTLGGGQPIEGRLSATTASPPSPGDRIRIAFRPDDALALASDS